MVKAKSRVSAVDGVIGIALIPKSFDWIYSLFFDELYNARPGLPKVYDCETTLDPFAFLGDLAKVC